MSFPFDGVCFSNGFSTGYPNKAIEFLDRSSFEPIEGLDFAPRFTEYGKEKK